MTNITDSDRQQFDAVRDGRFDNFALVSCFVNGNPTVAICSVNNTPSGEFLIHPLYIRPTDDMVMTDHDNIQTKSSPDVRERA